MLLLVLAFGLSSTWAQTPARAPVPGQVVLVEFEGKVEVRRGESDQWDPAYTNQVLRPLDMVRTGDGSRAVVRWSDLTLKRVFERSVFRVPEERRGGFDLFRGLFYLFHRDNPGELPVRTPTAHAIILGTEFSVAVADDGTTVISVLDGTVAMTNELGTVQLASGQAGRTTPGQRPEPVPMLEAANVIQWCLYYPGVLHVSELGLSDEAERALKESLEAYGSGDLRGALDRYPVGRQPVGDAEKVYRAALWLAMGHVDQAQALLNGLSGAAQAGSRVGRLTWALQRVMAAVKFPGLEAGQTDDDASRARRELEDEPGYETASEWVAESYYRQSRGRLGAALKAARRAVDLAPEFGFGWVRVAELEFGHGRVTLAKKSLEEGLQRSPRHAEGAALQGYLLAAENRMVGAMASFERAMALDSALGNAWLGRGLCRIRLGQVAAGLDDLQVAVVLEPQRAVLRSYLGKGASIASDPQRALKELNLAKRQDPGDPTAWLYSALVLQQDNRINEAVSDLEQSQALNDNRRVYRSSELLDQDSAVRGLNLATVYQDAAMGDVAVREAVHAVYQDYANFSAHWFLGNSLDALRDPRQVNVRYETAWLSEYLVANLLAPVAAGTLSPLVTYQEYGRLFERNRFGLVSETAYSSQGDWVQNAVHYGIFNNFSYAAEVGYRTENGFWPNQDLDQLTTTLKWKQQVSPRDVLFVQTTMYDAEGGDLRQHYQESDVDPDLRSAEYQDPLVLAGLQHQWAPGIHTLFLAGLVDGTVRSSTPNQSSWLLQKDAAGQVIAVLPGQVGQDYRSETELYTVEAQQILEARPHTLVFGVRYQYGSFDTRNVGTIASDSFVNEFGFAVPVSWFSDPPSSGQPDLERVSVYGYDYWQVAEPLKLVAGVSYDYLLYPENFRFAPVVGDEDSIDRVSPKAGFLWTPTEGTALRGAYSRALGGVSYDQSFRLEPSQVAGFNQAWRSLIPESVAGSSAAERFESWGLAWDQKFPSRTYVGVSGEWLESEVDRQVGVYDLNAPLPPTTPFVFQGATRQDLDYRERSVSAIVNQLLGNMWSVGLRYRFSLAELHTTWKDIPSTATTSFGFDPSQNLEAWLHEWRAHVLLNHPSGVFAMVEAVALHQDNREEAAGLDDETLLQGNLYAGYRFWRRRAELRVGLLNVSDQDYRINPLNVTVALPRERTVTVGLRFSF